MKRNIVGGEIYVCLTALWYFCGSFFLLIVWSYKEHYLYKLKFKQIQCTWNLCHHGKKEQLLITKHFRGKCKHTQQSQLLFQELFSPLKLKNIYYFLT